MLVKVDSFIGVYKITNPKNRVYVGSSIDINRRFRTYKKMNCKQQTKLVRSLKKYGSENHKFEILELCEVGELYNRENYYCVKFNVLGKNGLNCKIPFSDDCKTMISEETRLKLSNSRKGMVFSDEHKKNLRISKVGYIPSKETLLKLHQGAKNNRVFTDEYRKKLSQGRIGYKMSAQSRLKLSSSKKGKPAANALVLIDTNTGKEYRGVESAAKELGYSSSHLSKIFSGIRKNTTTLIKQGR